MREATKAIDKAKRFIPVIYKYADRPGITHYLGTLGVDYFIGEDGRVITQQELDEHLNGIYGD